MWELEEMLSRLREQAAEAALRDRGLTATAPVAALEAAGARAAGVPGRLLLVAAPAAAALAAFVLLARAGCGKGCARSSIAWRGAAPRGASAPRSPRPSARSARAPGCSAT
jgi:hypothetical protein